MIISFSGNDGVGKTTSLKELAKILDDLGFSVRYKHESEFFFLNHMLSLLNSDTVDRARSEMLEERKQDPKYYLWKYLLIVDTFLQYLYLKTFRRNEIVLLDRYPYDRHISFEYLGYASDFSAHFFYNFPKPDIAVVLTVDPEIAMKRKEETHDYPFSFYKRKTKRYVEVADKLDIPVIDTNREIEEVMADILDVCYRHPKFRKRFIQKGCQNKTIFNVLKEYEKTEFHKLIGKKYEERAADNQATESFLYNFLDDLGIGSYSVFKGYDRSHWIGNDLDLLISPDHFQKFRQACEEHPAVKKVSGNQSHFQAIDINLYDGLPIDCHTAIDWCGVHFFSAEDVLSQHSRNNRNGLQRSTVSFDATLYAISSLFEKGYVTYHAYQLIQERVDEDELASCISSQLSERYIKWINRMDPEVTDFPVFLPFSILFSAYREKIRSHPPHEQNYRQLATRFIFLLLWRARYRTTRKLPFEIYREFYDDI